MLGRALPPGRRLPGQPAELAGVAAGMLIGAVPGAQRQVATLDITPGTLVCSYTRRAGRAPRPGN